ncbi:sugar phosphate isomerase/epimerase family protein [Parapedobacter sp. 10938]|uniref:sugar phosphate isomerase/epimerase family protein n=1 Tax=Parapedobacter flavus TaxID=3110225 RepID=UPI002DBF5BE8|nr:sugar phosphate isomerase/epimerase family protein [Parapedobacter sp. 10938]MEC3881966.1 sugar phosphate isomerase/epimerase family protein [Parapedobacter sp. 10938]
MPKLAVFPKAFMKALCVTGEMTLDEWIDLASGLEIDGLEWYAGFLEMEEPKNWSRFRRRVGDVGLEIPMMCCSPDFTHPDQAFRNEQIGRQKKWIDMTDALGGRYCRVLSGQRRPELSIDEGVKLAADAIQECLAYAKTFGITLILENHYKDDFWKFPEFAQKAEVFGQIVDAIDDSHFGVNYDPSNAFLAGEDPLDLLEKVKYRIKTMHASDRYLVGGTIEDLRKMEDDSEGYASVLRHGEIGKGLNDYDTIFATLRAVGFDGWISIEDGVDGMDQLARSVDFVNRKIKQYW